MLSLMSPLAAIDPKNQLHGALLLMSIITLGLLGIGMVVGLGVTRRRHWARLKEEHRKQAATPEVDPWEEAGRRMQVPSKDMTDEDMADENAPDPEKNDEFTPL